MVWKQEENFFFELQAASGILSWEKFFERQHGNETGIKNVGIGRVVSLFFLVVGVRLSLVVYRHFIVNTSLVRGMVRYLH